MTTSRERAGLLCLPYAGGSARIYRRWSEELGPSIEVVPLEPAGRGTRFGEPFPTSIAAAVHDLQRRAAPAIRGKYALFGHSMGALLAWELARALVSASLPPPEQLFLSGKPPPHVVPRRPVHALPEAEFLRSVAAMGGTPREVLENDELMQIFLPVLRADYRMTETYAPRSEVDPLDCGITFFFATADPTLSRDQVEGWRRYTRGEFRILDHEGGHFFLLEKGRELAREMRHVLGRPESTRPAPMFVEAGDRVEV